MANKEQLNEEAAMNNNLSSSTYMKGETVQNRPEKGDKNPKKG
ncbi:hypothetical protein ACLM5H_03850 [Fredinandcohnia humi]